jgi:hypothetical protein
MCDISHKSGIYECVKLGHFSTKKFKKAKNVKYVQMCYLVNEINVTHFDSMRHFDTSETPRSSNKLDRRISAEGRVGAPTILVLPCNEVNSPNVKKKST